MGTMLKVSHLSKNFRSFKAVDDLSFEVPDGQVTGFLGPNGSGKSTTMRMCVGLETPTSGTATFDGTPFRELSNPATMVGTLLDANWFHPGRSARAHLGYMAALQGVSMNHVDDTLDRVGLTQVATKRVGGYSLGMKQRLGLACALIGEPKHLLLDEPVNGLDPEGVHWMRGLIRRSAAEGRAVLVSSHLLHEMELTADRLVVIGKGSLIGEYTMDEFLRTGAQPTIRMRVADPDSFVDATSRLDGVNLTRQTDGSLEFASEAPDLDKRLGELARDTGAVVLEMTPQRAGLEQKFLDATGQAVEYKTQDRRGQ